MTIDNRILIPFVTPFPLLVISRLILWMAGASWDASTAENAAILCLAGGVIGGTIVAFAFYAENITIGHIRIGKSKESDQ